MTEPKGEGKAEPDIAVALRYDPGGTDPPQVAAKGQGALAAQILAIAKAHDVHVRRDRPLADLVAKLDLESPIPVAAFAAVAAIVAAILARLYHEDQRLARGGRA